MDNYGASIHDPTKSDTFRHFLQIRAHLQPRIRAAVLRAMASIYMKLQWLQEIGFVPNIRGGRHASLNRRHAVSGERRSPIFFRCTKCTNCTKIFMAMDGCPALLPSAAAAIQAYRPAKFDTFRHFSKFAGPLGPGLEALVATLTCSIYMILQYLLEISCVPHNPHPSTQDPAPSIQLT